MTPVPAPAPGPDRFAADDRFVRALCARVAGDAHLADDAAQEAWLAGLQRAQAPALFAEFGRGWLCIVARNFVLQALRGSQHARVQALPDDYRQVVQQRFYEDRMPVEIADALGVPVETVRTRLKRALERLRAAITAPGAMVGKAKPRGPHP